VPAIVVFIFLVALPYSSLGQGGKKAYCDDAGYSQFDFWIGDWEVYSGDKFSGTNEVVKLWDCVVEENWNGTDGTKGKSFTTYNPKTNLWTQVWVDNSGRSLYFYGVPDTSGTMILEGVGSTSDGKEWYKLSFTPRKDGTVRQHWQSSIDAGSTWKSVFDGIYRRKE